MSEFKIQNFVFVLCVFFLRLVPAQIVVSDRVGPEDIQSKAKYICETILSGQNFNYAQNFSADFVNSIPEAYFKKLTLELNQTTGVCLKYKVIFVKESKALYQFESASGRYVSISFSLNPDKLIDGLQVKEVVLPDVVLNSWLQVQAYLQSLPGNTSFTVHRFDDNQKVQKNGDVWAPIGSGFKLYILGAMVDQIQQQNLKWEQNYPIKPELKSLPSGEMHNWKDGTLVPLKSFADYMIRISDNTATDHLIDILGRNLVESQLSLMGNDFVMLNKPFLTTAEMFKIKWAAPVDLVQSFLGGNELRRREILSRDIAPLALSKVGTNGIDMEHPAFIREIEWFASTSNLCSAMKYLKEKNSPEVLEILGQNIPNLIRKENSKWAYAGYKGGSEAGVLSMTYLLQNKNYEWGCFSVTWHNETSNLNLWILSDLAGKILNIIEHDHFGISDL
jgi:hypothetical protein